MSVWRFQVVAGAIVLTVIASLVGYANLQSVGVFLAVWLGVMGLMLGWMYCGAYYRHLQYTVDADALIIRRGVIWQSQLAVPRVRIQHSDVAQGPLQRRFGVGTLKLYTAGSRYTKVEVPGLSHSEALALRDELLPRDELPVHDGVIPPDESGV